MCVCVCACVRACVRACVHECVCAGLSNVLIAMVCGFHVFDFLSKMSREVKLAIHFFQDNPAVILDVSV